MANDSKSPTPKPNQNPKKPKLDLGDLRIGEVEMLLAGLNALSKEEKKSVIHSQLLRKLKSLKSTWEKTETKRKNTRQAALKSRAIKSKAFK